MDPHTEEAAMIRAQIAKEDEWVRNRRVRKAVSPEIAKLTAMIEAQELRIFKLEADETAAITKKGYKATTPICEIRKSIDRWFTEETPCSTEYAIYALLDTVESQHHRICELQTSVEMFRTLLAHLETPPGVSKEVRDAVQKASSYEK